MKAVFITYNQSITEEIQEILDKLSIRGYTQWTDIKGRGTHKGEPHEGTHTWPELNNAHLTMVEDEKVSLLLDKLRAFDLKVEQQGLRAFVWNIESFL
ncbi:MAG: PG0541 family transporter-associated protein [Bacteroidales bacterium]|jgi:nitrogen regulatory protein PII